MKIFEIIFSIIFICITDLHMLWITVLSHQSILQKATLEYDFYRLQLYCLQRAVANH